MRQYSDVTSPVRIRVVAPGRLVLIAGLLLMAVSLGLAQECGFHSLTFNDGLSQSHVGVVVQHHRGFIWFGAAGGGLNRFDGQHFEGSRHHSDDSTGLTPNTVTAFNVDEAGDPRVGTISGLHRFDLAGRSLLRFSRDPADPITVGSGAVTATEPDETGAIRVGRAGAGLRRADTASTGFPVLSLDPASSHSVSSHFVRSILVEGDGVIWDRLPGILAGIRAPTFPDRDFPVTDFGAVGDGTTDATPAFRAAVSACAATGGGRVVVPGGEYLTGTIHLMSNVNLHLEEGATLRFRRDPAAYLPAVLTRWEGVELMNYSPLVYAHGEKNVAVTGKGTLDGQAGPQHWWPWKSGGHPQSQKPDRDRLFAQAEAGVPVAERVYGAGHYLRPSFLQTYRCENVLIEGITITNAPMWVIHPVLSYNVIVRGVTVVSAGPNNDGCNPESSTDVLIEDSLFDTGDDCIAIKSGRNADGRRLAAPSERIVVRGCRMRAGHGGVTVGSEVSGSVRDVFVEQTEMSSPDLERGIRIKTNAVRGGVIENIFVRDVEIGETGAAIDIDMQYEEGADGPFVPVVRNILVERLTVRQARCAFFVRGLPGAPVRGLVVRDSSFRAVSRGSVLEHVEDLLLHNVVIQPAN